MEELKNHRLNLAAELERSLVNGPGARFVIWLQGCHLRCPGCFNPDFQPFVKRKLVSVQTLARRILSVEDIEGVTCSGGEPMMQAEPLYFLSSLLKKQGLTIMCYTGFTLDQLYEQQNPYVSRLLGLVDILIEGPYQEGEKVNLLWRGSTNQRVHFLTGTYLQYKPLIESSVAEMEFVIGQKGMALTGMVQERIVKKLLPLLNRAEETQEETVSTKVKSLGSLK